tara:strand:+ start:126 stop:455 length:330 start_codon:yes stop_codon:yes gene_type:complete
MNQWIDAQHYYKLIHVNIYEEKAIAFHVPSSRTEMLKAGHQVEQGHFHRVHLSLRSLPRTRVHDKNVEAPHRHLLGIRNDIVDRSVYSRAIYSSRSREIEKSVSKRDKE